MKKFKEMLSGRRGVGICVITFCMLVSGSIAYAAATENGYNVDSAMANGGWTSSVTGIHYNSYGQVNYTDGTSNVIVDAADIATIDEMVGNGKKNIKNAIKSVDVDDRLGTSSWDESTYPDFESMANMIVASQSLSETQTGTQAVNNKGEALYYKDQTANDTKDLTQTCTDNTGYPVYYQPATAANLTAGSAAFIDGQLILGTGADNDTYFDLGYTDGMAYVTGNSKIIYTYHKHSDSDGNEQKSDYRSNVLGGCFTTENIIYANTTGSCGGWIGYSHTSQIYDDENGKWVNWDFYKCTGCGKIYAQDNIPASSICSELVNKKVDSGKRYYTLGCGKTETAIESATIIFN